MSVNLKTQPHVFTAEEQRAYLLDFIANKATEADLRRLRHQVGLIFADRLSELATAASEELGLTDEDFENWLNDPNQ